MIHYIENKNIRYNNIEKLLLESKNKRQFTNNGPIKNRLEQTLEELIECPPHKRVLCTSNGTTALHALQLFYEKNYNLTQYVSTSFTFPSCMTNKMNTRVVDICQSTNSIDKNDINKSDVVLITNLFGTNCMPNYELNNFIIYDNASSFLSKFNNKNMCLYGNAAFSSLHHTKTLGFGEGGFIVIDADAYDEIQSMLCFGFIGSDRTYNKFSSNYKMSEISAAFILDHILNYDINKHMDLQNEFLYRLPNNVSIFNPTNTIDKIFYGNIPVIFNDTITPEIFRNNGIEANKYYKPIINTPNATSLYNKIINFPIHQQLSVDDIHKICKVIELL